MEWYQYVEIFFSGAFLGNVVPHFVNGVSGNKFPTPFAKPPGKGLSSATTNVLWAGFNMIAGFVLLRTGKLQIGDTTGMIVFFAGIMAISLMASNNFPNKDKE